MQITSMAGAVSPAEVLKRLNPAVQGWEVVSRGINGLTPADISAFLAGLSYPAMCLGMAKYALVESYRSGLWGYLYQWAAGQAVAERWKIQRGVARIGDLARIVTVDVIDDHRCHACHGTGVIRPTRSPGRLGLVDCPRCSGSGYERASGRCMAERLGVSETAWRETWNRRYGLVWQEAQNVESELMRKLARELREPS